MESQPDGNDDGEWYDTLLTGIDWNVGVKTTIISQAVLEKTMELLRIEINESPAIVFSQEVKGRSLDLISNALKISSTHKITEVVEDARIIWSQDQIRTLPMRSAGRQDESNPVAEIIPVTFTLNEIAILGRTGNYKALNIRKATAIDPSRMSFLCLKVDEMLKKDCKILLCSYHGPKIIDAEEDVQKNMFQRMIQFTRCAAQRLTKGNWILGADANILAVKGKTDNERKSATRKVIDSVDQSLNSIGKGLDVVVWESKEETFRLKEIEINYDELMKKAEEGIVHDGTKYTPHKHPPICFEIQIKGLGQPKIDHFKQGLNEVSELLAKLKEDLIKSKQLSNVHNNIQKVFEEQKYAQLAPFFTEHINSKPTSSSLSEKLAFSVPSLEEVSALSVQVSVAEAVLPKKETVSFSKE